MRFAMTITDRYIGVFQALIERRWTPLKIFTTEVDHRLHHHAAVLDLARRLNIEVQISRLTEANLRELSAQGCEALVVASYRWRIGDWRPYLRYGVNVHPSPLPHGRGPYPIPAAILEQARRWGVACHKLEHEFDAGDVLRTIEFPLSADEDHDSLDLKIQLAARKLGAEIAEHLADDWDRARPQAGSTYYPAWTPQDRLLDFSQTVAEILRRVRAFGPFECVAVFNQTRFFVRRAVGWVEAHAYTSGTVVYVNSLAMVIAAADGFIGLTQWSLIEASAVIGTRPR